MTASNLRPFLWLRRTSLRASAAFVVVLAVASGQRDHLSAQALSPQGPTIPDLAHPAAAPSGAPVSLGDLITEALDRNPDLLAIRQDAVVARQRPAQARTLDPPMIEAQAWQWPTATIDPSKTDMYMFMVSQDFPGRGKRELRAAVADKEVALADADIAARTRDVINGVKQAYAVLFLSRKAIQVHLDSVELLRQITDASQAKYTTGRMSQQDVLKPIVELSRLHTDILGFEAQASQATARLNALRDRAPETPIGPLVELQEQIVLPVTGDLQRLALERQPDLQRARGEVARAGAALAAARSEDKPDFSVQGGYMLLPQAGDAWTARVGITWPRAPWSRGKVNARVAEQTAAVEAANARVRALENMTRLSVQAAYIRATSARDRAALLRTTILPQSRHALDASRVGYQNDRVDIQAVLDSERVELDVTLDYFRAIGDLAQAVADLERAIGTDLPAGATALVSAEEDR